MAQVAEDALYTCVGRAGDEERRLLLALRRDVHSGRTPAVVPSGLPAAAEAWLAAHRSAEALSERVAQLYPRALEEERATLRALLGNADLRRALALLAPEVERAAERYRAARVPGRGDRKSERGLLQYVTRGMVRTSPLSRFTAVGLRLPTAGAPDPTEVTFDGARSFPSLDRVMFTHVFDGLTDQEVSPKTWVRQPPTAHRHADGTRYTFLRATDQGVRRLSAQVEEPLRTLLALTEVGPRQLSQVAADLARVLDRNVSETVHTVLSALRTGILCTTGFPEDGRDRMPELLHQATARGAEELRTLRTGLAKLAEAPPEDRPALLTGMRSAAEELSRAAARPATVLVEEDYVLPPGSVDTTAWRGRLADLSAAVEFMSAFDRLHEIRALATAAFTDRFHPGASVPLCEYAEDLVREVYRRHAAFQAGDEQGLDRLRSLRATALAKLYDTLDGHDPDAPELPVAPELLTGLVADLPEQYRRTPLAYGVLVQPWQQRLVFNDAYSGHGMLYGRFLGFDGALGGQAGQRLAQRLQAHYGRRGAVLAQELGLHRLNVNAHAPVLDTTLTADDWYLMRLVHDKDSDRLRIERPDGTEVIPLTLGAGFPELYPAPVRLAVWLASAGRLVTDVLGGYRQARAPQAVRLPRLTVGSVVLQRRRWYLDEELRAVAAAHPEGPERLAALAAFRARHDLPAEVLVKTEATATRQLDLAQRRRQKPQYLDLESALITRVLNRMLERRHGGCLEEALPCPADSPHAYEWVVEIGRRAGGTFAYLDDLEGTCA
ncbi:hypothetical protein ACFVY4_24835 [Streptomyces sp. NPDC058299]|uniref:hypothetical protein n=1 Tax=Streptomyces sp. NPDC058299 TaxID=3346435 RepID=UPI0036E4A88F